MDHKSESVCAIIDRFMLSEATGMLMLASTLKTMQSVARNTHRFFF